jgi:hypothetical protein
MSVITSMCDLSVNSVVFDGANMRSTKSIVHSKKRSFANVGWTLGTRHIEVFLPLPDDMPHAIIQLIKGLAVSGCSSAASIGYTSSIDVSALIISR